MQQHKKLTSSERRRRELKRQRKAEEATQNARERLASILQQDRKRRHHVVWRHYLEAWSDRQGLVWCQSGENRFQASTRNIAVEKDFYEMKELDDRSHQYLDYIVSKITSLQDRLLAQRWLSAFRRISTTRELLEVYGAAVPEIERAIQILLSNTVEDYHSEIEASMLSVLPSLQQGDGSQLLDDSVYENFSLFLGSQFSRTAALQSKSLPAFHELPDANAEAMWGVLRIIFSINIAGDLYRNRKRTKIELLDFSSAGNFLTGDQPVVNLGGLKHVELYYPLSPYRAMIVTPESETSGIYSRSVTQAELEKYNLIIVGRSEQIFAAAEEVLSLFSTPEG
jgi:hypothetical protein